LQTVPGEAVILLAFMFPGCLYACDYSGADCPNSR
jgi:hypothetical protein